MSIQKLVIPNISKALQDSQGLFGELQKDKRGFTELSQILRGEAGIHLADNLKNHCLMASRLVPVLRGRGLSEYRQFLEVLKAKDARALKELVSAMTTNTTQFFRENKHFDHLKSHVLPDLLSKKAKAYQREIRVWCAAASTGQEPYTIAMTLLDVLNDTLSWDLKMLGTDIDMEVLERAARGVYTEQEVASVPPLYRQKHFRTQAGGNGSKVYAVSPQLHDLIRFAPLNLTDSHYPFQHRFDLIFCRNVLIYFEPKMASHVVDQLIAQLSPGGYLFLGHSESGAMRSDQVTMVSHAVYQKVKSHGKKRP